MTLYDWGENGLADDEETGFFMSVLSESPLHSLKRLLISPLSSFSSYCRLPPTKLVELTIH